jgi:hypothetical protein
MYDHLNLLSSKVRARDLQREAELWRISHRNGDGHRSAPSRLPLALLIRMAAPADEAALARLAQVDGHRELNGPQLLVAEVDGVLIAALPLDGGKAAIADPFRPTAAVVEMLELRAGQLRNGPAHPRRGLRARFSRLLRGGAHRPAVAPATPGNARMLIPRD